MRELPFTNIRETAFHKALSVSAVLKSELQSVKIKLKEQNKESEKKVNALREQLGKFIAENNTLKERINTFESSSQQNQCQNHLDKIQELEFNLASKFTLVQIITERYDEKSEELRKEKAEKMELCNQQQQNLGTIEQLIAEIHQLRANQQWCYQQPPSTNYRHYRGHYR